MDTISGDFKGRHHFGCEALEFCTKRFNEIRDGLFNVLFVNCFVIQEPFAIIIALQVPEELETFFWER